MTISDYWGCPVVVYRKQVEIEDPLVIQLGIQAGLDTYYVVMVNCIENKTSRDVSFDTVVRTF